MQKPSIDELAKTMRAEYQRSWRKDNKERVKKHNAEYWRKRAAARLSKAKANS